MLSDRGGVVRPFINGPWNPGLFVFMCVCVCVYVAGQIIELSVYGPGLLGMSFSLRNPRRRAT